MSNNNNITNALSGIFRSMSRRSQHQTDADEGSSQQRGDVEMNSPQDLSTASNADPTFNTEQGNQSDDSMPVLRDVSDSEDGDHWTDESDAEDDGMDTAEGIDIFAQGIIGNGQAAAFMPVIAGYPVFAPSEDHDETMPPLESVSARPQGTRRARVEVEDDVGDSERDRRHPYLRASNSHTPAATGQGTEQPQQPRTSYPEVIGGVPGVGIGAAGPLPPNPHRRARRHQQQHYLPMQLMAQMGYNLQGGPGQPADAVPQPQPNPQMAAQPEGNGQPQGAVPNRLGTLLENLIQAAGQGGTATFSTAIPITGNVPGLAGAGNGGFFGNLFTAMDGAFTVDGGGNLFGFRPAQEPEDPERAKVLVDGLEDVPVGLVRRLERISPESSGCAICWEKLLEDDAEYLKREEDEAKKAAEDGTASECNHDHKETDSVSASPSSSSSKEHPVKKKTPKYPRIVTLPCSHVFHAECLIPWFTRPHQTTCPTCRFNIDPDNLTWGVGARRQRAAASAAGTPAPATPSVAPQLDSNGFPVPFSGNPQELPQRTSFGFFSVSDGAGGTRVIPVPHDRLPVFPTPGANPGALFGPSLTGPINIPEPPASFFRTASNRSMPPGGPASRPPAAPRPTGNNSASRHTLHVTGGTPVSNTPTTNASPVSGSGANSIPPPPPPQPQAQPQIAIPIQLTPEQMRVLSQSFIGRLFGGEGAGQGPQPPQPSAGHGASAVTPANSGPAPPSTQPNIAAGTVPNAAHPYAMPLHFHHHHLGNGVAIGFDFVVRNDSGASGGDDDANQTAPAGDPVAATTPGVNPSPDNGSTEHSHVAQGAPDEDAGFPLGEFTMNIPIDASDIPSDEAIEGLDIQIDINEFGPFAVPDDDDDQIPHPATQEPPRASHSNAASATGTIPSYHLPSHNLPHSNVGIPAGTIPSYYHSPQNPPHVLPPNFALFRRPTNTSNRSASSASRPQQPGGQRRSNAGGTDNSAPANAGPNPNRRPQDLTSYITSMLDAAIPGLGGAAPGTRPQTARRGTRTRERRPWAPPAAPGMTLRQTIEKREREAGLRCWDVSCGVGPSDEDPFVTITDAQKRQIRIRQQVAASDSAEDGKGKGKEKEKTDEEPEPQYVCPHTFHPPCIVSAQRAALNGAEEVVVEDGKSVEVSCPVCRATGVVSREDWEEGVRALELGLD